MITLYGISNCDTIRKARRWLKDAGIEYHFHDYRKEGIDESMLQHWIEQLDWEQLVNKRGTTWRQLPEDIKSSVDAGQALKLMLEQPAMIKRPLLDLGDKPVLGFSPSLYSSLFSKRTF
ncbi:ArsC family reductase [Endozoicomonas sp. Mp262]|uniref:ArsC family reductase n=1 Tax=Endozoicomonas sp. Mp262 TaxID=2919499 RepID=UPI0021DFD890